MSEKNKASIQLIASMIIFGTIGLFRRFIPLPSSILAMLRGLIGMIFLVIFMLIARKKISFKSIKKNLLLLIISGVMLGANWILLFEAYNYTTVAVATLCYYMAPIFVIIVSPFLLKEKLGIKKVICIIVALIGMLFVSGILRGGSDIGDFRGVLFGIGAAVLYASVIILNKKITGISAYDKTIVQLLASTVVILPYSLITEDVRGIAISPLMIAMVLVVGIVHTGIAYALYFGSMDQVPAQRVALFGYIDPVVAILISIFALNEYAGDRLGLIYSIIGVVCVLGATLFSELSVNTTS